MKKKTHKFIIISIALLMVCFASFLASASDYYSGYVTVPIDSYDSFKNATNGNGYDVDYSYGCQCWDGASLFWHQLGMSLATGPNHSAYECWTVSKESNSGSQFKLITSKTEIKRGDVVVFSGPASTGHIAFADENYNETDTLSVYGQNQYGDSSGDPFSTADYSLKYFLGAFRYIEWEDTTPPTVSSYVNVSNVSTDSFTLTFNVSDDIAVTDVWADVRPGSGDADAYRFTGTCSGSTATVVVETDRVASLSGSESQNYYITCGAGDASGNSAEVHIEHERISVYPVTVHTGTFKATQDTAAHYEPCEEIDGKTTETIGYVKGASLSGVGTYTNQWGATYLLTANGDWVYADHVRYQMQWSDIWEAIRNFVFGKDIEIVYFAGQALESSETANLNSMAIMSAEESEPDALLASSNTSSIKIYGNVVTYSNETESYSASSYTISFDANGGSVSMTAKTAYEGSTYGTLPTPYRLGYRFDGWFDDNGIQVSSSTVCTGNVTLHAQWTRIVLLQGSCGDSLTFILYGDGEMIVEGSGAMTSHPWTADSYRQRVVEVTLPEEMTAFCSNAFYNCTYLQEINIPDVTDIPQYCFYGCSYLGSIDLQETVTSIGDYALANSGLQSLTLPSSLTTLGYNILDGNTGVKSINIPAALSTVNHYSGSYDNFSSSTPRRSVYGPFSNSAVESVTITTGLESIHNYLFTNAAHLKNITIPNTVSTIGEYAFYGTDALESISIPDSVTVINKGAFAYSGLTSLTLPKYLTTMGTYILYGNTGVKSIVLPNTINELTEPAKWGSPGPFYGSAIETAELQEGSTTLYGYCFEGASKLESIDFPDSLTAIQGYAFSDCTALQTVVIPYNVTSIGDFAFRRSGLTEITLPDNLTTIGSYAFAETPNLTSLTLPSGLTTLGYCILDGNTGVKSINIPAALSTVNYYSGSYNNFSYSTPSRDVYGPFSNSAVESATITSGLESIHNYLFTNAIHLKNITIPNTVSKIGEYAFYGTDALESISIPDSVTVINKGAFAYSGLTSLTLPKYLTTMGTYILYGNTGVKSIVLPNTINELTEPAKWGSPGPFYGSAIETAELQEGSTTLYEYCFKGASKLESIDFPDSLTAIQGYAFSDCTALQTVVIPSNVTSIGDFAFLRSGLTEITLPDNLTTIGSYAFAETPNLTSLTLPSGLTTLGYCILDGNTGVKSINIPAALSTVNYYSGSYNNFSYSTPSRDVYGPFSNSAVESATITSGLESIHNYLFTNAIHLKNITIPNTVSKIGEYAFYGTDALESISIPDSVTVINKGAFAYSGFSSIEGGKNLKTISDYSFYNSKLEEYLLDANLDTFGSSVFTGCSRLRAVKIGSVPNNTFKGCSSLENVEIGDSAASIGDYAFSGCSNLTTLTLGKNLKSIGRYAFNDCSSLNSADIPDSVSSVGSYAFCNCKAMSECRLSNTLQSIGMYAFSDCDSLVNIIIPDSVTTLGTYTFYDCDSLQSATLSTELKTIEAYTFAHCDSLASIVIPSKVTTIGNYAFAQDVSLISATIPRSVTSIGTEAFNYPDRLTIHGITGTYAETWASSNGFTFAGNEVHATSVELASSELTIEKGAYYDLTATILPAGYTDAVNWKSDNESVATVTEDGKIYGKATGTATIRVSVGESGLGANCAVTVIPASPSVTLSISLNYSSRTITAPETFLLKASTSTNSILDSVTWSSSDSSVASVDDNGLVTALKKGTATIYATAKTVGGVTRTASCTITVPNTVYIADSAEAMQSPHNYENNCGDVWSYTYPEAEKLTLVFDERTNVESGFDYLYIYDGNGTQIGKYTGTTLAGQSVEVSGDTVRIKLTSDNLNTAYGFSLTSITPKIFQYVAAQGMSLGTEYVNLALNASSTLVPVFDPLDATNQEVTWSTSNKDIVSVSKDGVICGISGGTAVITATADDGGFTASVTVRVSETSALGDVNNDGDVDSADAMLVLRASVNLVSLTDVQKAAADVNGDGNADIGDAVLILRYDVGYIYSFPAEEK